MRVLSRFSRVWLLATPWTVARQAPLSRDSPGKNTGVGCHSLQGMLQTQGSKPTPESPMLQADSLPLRQQGSPVGNDPTLKRSEALTLATLQMNLEDTMVSERSQTQKTT